MFGYLQGICEGDVGTRDNDARNIDLDAVRKIFDGSPMSKEAWEGFFHSLQGAEAAWARDLETRVAFSPKTAATTAKLLAKARKHIGELNRSSDFEFLAWTFCNYHATDQKSSFTYSRDMEGLMRLEALLTKLGKSKGKRGPDRTPIYFFVYRLYEAYTCLTGNPVTHNPYDGTNR